MSENNFNLKKFRELLKKGIGSRTQREFAAQTGIANVTINRMLNNENLPCPKVSTLETFAMNMSNVTLNELLSACGYEIPSLEDIVLQMESDISDFFAFESLGTNIFTSLDEIIVKMAGFLKRRSVTITNKKNDIAIPSNMELKGAENTCTIEVEWNYDKVSCTTIFNIFYLMTVSGKIVFIGTDIDEIREGNGKIRNTYIRKTKKKISLEEERLLSAIFGELYDENGNPYKRLPTVYIGYGFEINNVPEGFIDFLNKHSNTFCDSKENIELYNRIISGESPEDVFENYLDIAYGHGIGAVISDIMSKETGKEYIYWEKDENIPEEEQNACVMLRADNDIIKKIDKETLIYLYECAKTLKLPTFGVVYYKTSCRMAKSQVYKTDDFWLNEK